MPKKRRIKLEEMREAIAHVASKYTGAPLHNSTLLSALICKEFEIDCRAEDIENYAILLKAPDDTNIYAHFYG